MRLPLLSSLATLLLLPTLALAQQQVDTQIGPVDTRVGGELYGNNADPPRQQGYQIKLLPSEERYAIWRSGVLPSEERLAREAAGPLTPNGILDYLPRQSYLQRVSGMPAPRLYNPAYDPAAAAARRAGAQSQLPGPARGFPQNLQQGLQASNARTPAPAVSPRQALVPSLTPAPDRQLQSGPLFDNIRYNPNSTPGARLLNKVPTTQRSLSEQQPQPTTRP
jgi:hypothetical protein